MKKLYKFICNVFIGAILLGSLQSNVYATGKITVEIPKFNVILNKQVIHNKTNQYPLIVYKDITYFPLTASYAKALGIQLRWDGNLHIYQGGEGSKEFTQQGGGKNVLGGRYSASLPAYDIYIDDQKFDNAKETYPILNFRDITYIPMTWKFAHDILGLTLSWNQNSGLELISYYPEYIDDIIFDDTEYLYFSSGYYTAKNLNGKLIKASQTEHEALLAQIGEEAKLAVELVSPDTYQLTKEGFVYEGTALMSLAEIQAQIVEFDDISEETIHINRLERYVYKDTLEILFLRLDYATWIPAPYTPHLACMFVLNGEELLHIEDNVVPYRMTLKNIGNQTWLYQQPDYNVQENKGFIYPGYLYELKRDEILSLNSIMEKSDIEWIGVKDEVVYLKAYNNGLNRSGLDSYYTMKPEGEPILLTEVSASNSYMDIDGNIWLTELDKKINRLSELLTGKQRSFYFYESEIRK